MQRACACYAHEARGPHVKCINRRRPAIVEVYAGGGEPAAMVKKDRTQDDPPFYHSSMRTKRDRRAPLIKFSSTQEQRKGTRAGDRRRGWGNLVSFRTARRSLDSASTWSAASLGDRRSYSAIPKGSRSRWWSTTQARSRSPANDARHPGEKTHRIRGFGRAVRAYSSRWSAASGAAFARIFPGGVRYGRQAQRVLLHEPAARRAEAEAAGTVHHVAWGPRRR